MQKLWFAYERYRLARQCDVEGTDEGGVEFNGGSFIPHQKLLLSTSAVSPLMRLQSMREIL